MKKEELLKMIEEMQNNDLRKVVEKWSGAIFDLGWFFALEKLKDKIKEAEEE